MASANNNRIMPLSSASIRMKSPTTKAKPSNISTTVEAQASAGHP
jgi:hypothetical protein